MQVSREQNLILDRGECEGGPGKRVWVSVFSARAGNIMKQGQLDGHGKFPS